jgi:hypothetical protein
LGSRRLLFGLLSLLGHRRRARAWPEGPLTQTRLSTVRTAKSGLNKLGPLGPWVADCLTAKYRPFGPFGDFVTQGGASLRAKLGFDFAIRLRLGLR